MLTGTAHLDTFTRTVAAGGVGTADDGHTYTTSPSLDFSVNGTRALVTVDLTLHTMIPVPTLDLRDSEDWFEFQVPSAPTGANYSLYRTARYQDASNMYRVRVVVTTASKMTLQLQRVVAGASTDLASQVTLSGTVTFGVVYILHWKVTGTNPTVLEAGVGLASAGDPGVAMLTVNDNDPAQIVAAGNNTLRSVMSTGATSTMAVQIPQLAVDTLDAAAPPPDPPNVTWPTNPVNSSPISIPFTLPTAGSSAQVSVDGGAFGATTSPYSLTISAGQTRSVVFRAIGADLQLSTTVSGSVTRQSSGGGGSTGLTFTPSGALAGYRIRALVSGVNVSGTASPVATPWSAPIIAAGTTPVNTRLPEISDPSPTIGQQLVADPGDWTGGGNMLFSYDWKVNGVIVASGPDNAYTPTGADVGLVVTVTVHATNEGGSQVATSTATAAVSSAAPQNIVPPSIVGGSFNVGDNLTVDDGEWSGSQPMTFTHQWQRSLTGVAPWANITGARFKTYKLSDADLGEYIRCVVTADNGL